MSRKEQEEKQGTIATAPRVLSVTGHRDLRPQDAPALEAAVRSIFAQYLADTDAPIYLLSMLAEGADQLAARVALQSGMRLIAPLPLPRELYERDFDTAESRREFHTLLEQAEQIITLPLIPSATLASVAEYGPERDRQYALGGAFLAQYSQAMLALWDGINNGKAGGTGEVVGFMLNGVPAPYREALRTVPTPFNKMPPSSPGGLVYQIVTPRASINRLPSHPLSIIRHDPALNAQASAAKQD